MASVPPPLPRSELIRARLADDPYVVPAGMHLHHVHPSVFPANSFSPGGCGRFHPFSDTAGNPMPCLYAADSIAGSYIETVFRSIGEKSCTQVPAKRLRQFSHALLTARKELRLAHLSGDTLDAYTSPAPPCSNLARPTMQTPSAGQKPYTPPIPPCMDWHGYHANTTPRPASCFLATR